MAPIVETVIATLNNARDMRSHNDALLHAAFLFEKSHGLTPCAWPDEVLAADVNHGDIVRLQGAVVAYVQRHGVGSWALSKCFDPAVKPVLVAVLRRQLEADAGELYQAMIALENLGEPVFGERGSCSILEESRNRELARVYLHGIGELPP